MVKRSLQGLAVLGLMAALVTTTYARDCTVDCDNTLRQGRVFEAWDSTVVYGSGDTELVRVWVPLLMDDAKPFLQSAVIQVYEGPETGKKGRILGAVTTYRYQVYPPRLVVCYGTVDNDFSGMDPIGSNDIVVWETGDLSDTAGQMLIDGSLVWRANFGTAQNNIEWEQLTPDQITNPEPGFGNKVLVGDGIDGAGTGNAYLGTPAAIENGANFYMALTAYDGGSGAIGVGVNIWDYDRVTPSPSGTADYLYTQAGAETFANANGVACDPGDGRQTQPAFGKANDVLYVVFGINDTNNGGSARPGLLCVDAFEDGDGYTNAVAILPPTGFNFFVDHQATGGGSNVFENKHFDMNASGQIVALAEKSPTDETDPSDPPTWQVLLYDPQFTGNVITGYSAPLLIADAGQFDQKPEDGLAGPFYYQDPNDPNSIVTWYNSISGVGVNDAGNVAFTATYDTGDPFDPNDPNSPTIWNNAAYFYDAGATTLHQVLFEDDIVGHNSADPNYPSDVRQVTIGLISREDSDAFFGPSLADNANVMTVCFREHDEDEGPSRGVAVVAFGHSGDTDFDGDVELTDLAQLLGAYGTTFGVDANYDSQSDFNLNGRIELADLAELLGNYGT